MADIRSIKDPVHPRYRTAKGEDTEVVAAKFSPEIVRKMAEIVESREDPDIRTRSDILRDAVMEWIERWYKTNPQTKLIGRLGAEISRERSNRQYIDDIISTLHEEVALANQRSNTEYLKRIYVSIQKYLQSFHSIADPQQLKSLQELELQVRTLL